MVLGRTKTFKMMKGEEDLLDANNIAQEASHKKKRSRRRRKPRSTNNATTTTTTTSHPPTQAATPTKVKPVVKSPHNHNNTTTSSTTSKRPHDSPMTKRDLYFSLHCGLVSIAHGNLAVARVTMINYDAQVVLDTFVQVPVPVLDFGRTGITPQAISPKKNPQAMSFAQVRQSVRQILRGKIVVGHDLGTSLKALGLTHPTSDMRDASMFRFFQYDQVDGVTQQRVVVQRPLVDLAAEFLQRDLPISCSAMDMCMAQLELYKTFRKEWETELVEQGRSTHNNNHRAVHAPPAVPSYGTRSRTSSFDVDSSSVAAYSSYAGSSTYDASSSSPTTTRLYHKKTKKNHPCTRPRSDSCEENYPPAAAPLLTSENLEMLTQYNRYNHHHHNHFYPPGSSVALSEYSSYTAASESLQLQEEEETTASSSWFRFGPRKSKYVTNRQQQASQEPSHMTSWNEEPEDGSRRTMVIMGELDEYHSHPYPNNSHHNSLQEEEVDFQQNHNDDAAATVGQSSSSWFAFRRPKSPSTTTTTTTPPAAAAGLSSSSAFVKVLEPEDAARSATAVNVAVDTTLPPVDLGYYYDGNSEAVLRDGKQQQQQQQQPSSSWFSSFRRPKSPGPGVSDQQRPVTPLHRRRSSMGGTTAATTTTATAGPDLSERSDKSNNNNHMLDSSPSSMSHRHSKSLDNVVGTAARSNKHHEDAEKSTANSSWFSFRRSTGKSSSKDPQQQQQPEISKEDAADSSSFLVLQEQPTLQTVGSEEAGEDDWIREVVGSPRTQEKELRVFTELGFEASLPHNPQVSRPLKESKWLPRFLRSSKSSTTSSQSEHVEFSAQEEVQGDLFSVQQQQQQRPKSTLNPAFFSEDESNLPRHHRSRSFTRDRLETEVTHLDDDLSLSSEDMIVAMARDMEQNLAYLTL